VREAKGRHKLHPPLGNMEREKRKKKMRPLSADGGEMKRGK